MCVCLGRGLWERGSSSQLTWESWGRRDPFSEGSDQLFPLSDLGRYLQVGLSHLQATLGRGRITGDPGVRLARELSARPRAGVPDCLWGRAWPGSRSRPGARAEARDRPRSASGARGERVEVPGMGLDKGQRPSCLAGQVPKPRGRGPIGAEARWWPLFLHLPWGPTLETVLAWEQL